MRTVETGPLAANPVPQVLFDALILISTPSPVDKSDVTTTLFPPAIQLLPVEVLPPIDQLAGNWYS